MKITCKLDNVCFRKELWYYKLTLALKKRVGGEFINRKAVGFKYYKHSLMNWQTYSTFWKSLYSPWGQFGTAYSGRFGRHLLHAGCCGMGSCAGSNLPPPLRGMSPVSLVEPMKEQYHDWKITHNIFAETEGSLLLHYGQMMLMDHVCDMPQLLKEQQLKYPLYLWFYIYIYIAGFNGWVV
jgi:hypothetical protein